MQDPTSIFALSVSPLLIGLGAVVGVIVIVGLLLVTIYNKLVRIRQTCKESWSDIDTELQRRHDLIPNLVSTVKGYAAHEKGVLEQVTKLRNQAVEAKDGDAKTRAGIEDMLQGSVGKLIATAEAYPDLKANQNFLELQKELADTETRVARARRFYNANVREFRASTMTFPSNLVAGSFGFQSSEFSFFEASASDRAPIEVDATDFG